MRVGIIGFGLRARVFWDAICKYDVGVELCSICDIRNDEIKKQLADMNIPAEKIAFYEDADEMLNNEILDGVIVSTRCSLHTKMAIKVINKNIPLLLEKPVSTNIDELKLLKNAYEKNPSPVVVSFPLRATPMIKLVKEIVDSGDIGTIEHIQAFNNVPYGRVYYQSWYRDEAETGGLFLQKATHDFDYINYLLDIKPVKICAMTSKQIYKGDKPAGLSCRHCEEYETCFDSPFYLKNFSYDEVQGDMCCYAVDTGNEDSGSAIIRYESGMHVNYTQNFFARKEARKRGAILIGNRGTIEFDWYKHEAKVYMHHFPLVKTYQIDTSGMGHSGGDSVLAYNFINIMRKKENSIAPMEAGILSALMCIKAKESAVSEKFIDITI